VVIAATVALLAAAIVLLVPVGSPRRRLRGVIGGDAVRTAGWSRWRSRIPGGRAPIVLVASVGAVAGCVAGGPVAGLAGALYGGAGARALSRRRLAKECTLTQLAALDAVAGLADDLRAGRTPQDALAAAVATIEPVVDEVTRRALRSVTGGSGTDLVAALRAVRHPGLEPVFARLATVWQLTDAGVPLAALLDGLESELRAHRRAADQAQAQLAAARTTARLLAALPVIGLGLGFALGIDPLGIVLRTVPGGVCAVVAMALQLAGTAWTERLGRTAVTP